MCTYSHTRMKAYKKKKDISFDFLLLISLYIYIVSGRRSLVSNGNRKGGGGEKGFDFFEDKDIVK